METPDHIVLWDEDRSLMMGGDAMLVNRNYAGPSPPRYTVDRAPAIRSFRRVAAMEFENLVTGHGGTVLGGTSRAIRERGV
jgi:glyoxylase-like metal-dependent hydrolase (beta-lactamase superfamily II)